MYSHAETKKSMLLQGCNIGYAEDITTSTHVHSTDTSHRPTGNNV